MCLWLACDPGGGGWEGKLCPVAPFNMRARATLLRQLPESKERDTVHTWLLVGSGFIVVAKGGCSSWLHSHHSGTVSC